MDFSLIAHVIYAANFLVMTAFGVYLLSAYKIKNMPIILVLVTLASAVMTILNVLAI